MKAILIAVAVVAALAGAVWMSQSDYRAFSAQREDWHRRCDAYIGTATPANLSRAADCKAELDELTAYAKRKGWL